MMTWNWKDEFTYIDIFPHPCLCICNRADFNSIQMGMTEIDCISWPGNWTGVCKNESFSTLFASKWHWHVHSNFNIIFFITYLLFHFLHTRTKCIHLLGNWEDIPKLKRRLRRRRHWSWILQFSRKFFVIL